jgi:Domain of unknown function (DUF4252)
MKKLFLVSLAILPLLAFAQNNLNDFISKYSGKSGFTSVNISPKMMHLVSSLDMSDADMQAIKDVTSMQVLVHEGDADKANDLYSEASKNIGNDYDELMAVKEDETDLKILAKPSDPGYVKDLLIVGRDGDDFVLVNINGKISMDDLSKLSDHISIKDLDHLKDLQKDHDDDDDDNN